MAAEDITASEQPLFEEAINLNIQQRRARDVEEGRIVPGSGHVDIRSLMQTDQGVAFYPGIREVGKRELERTRQAE